MTNATTVFETVYSDGSGATGLYVLYGIRIAGSRDHEGRVSANPPAEKTPRNISRRQAGIIATACRAVERHMASLDCPAWIGD